MAQAVSFPAVSSSPPMADRRVRLVWVVGLVLSGFFFIRGQVAGDQLNLLARGYLLVSVGDWIPYGNPMSTGGKSPGGVTSLLVGLPLFVWRHHRAATLVVLLFHLVAYAILDRLVKKALSPFERVAFAVLYWLNPWRLYFSGFLWNPNYLFLVAAVHLSACFAQRDRPRFGPSAILLAALGLGMQIHASALLLVVATGVLWWRGQFRLHWLGALLGSVVATLPLVPWYLEMSAHPEILTDASRGFLGRGLLLVFPLLRGLLYWLRYPSLAISDRLARFDFTSVLGAPADAWLAPVTTFVVRWLLPITLLVPVLANAWLVRRARRWFARRPLLRPSWTGVSSRRWLAHYVLAALAAAIVVYSLSPTTVMMWQGVSLFPAAILGPVLFVGVLARRPRGPRVGRWLGIHAVLSVIVALAVGSASPQYRCGGRHGVTFPLVANSPMFEELGIQRTCPWPLDQPGGWWPDVLPKGAGR